MGPHLMCRFAGYLGRPAPLASLLTEPPHGLEVQAYAPREMVSGTVNVDGTGVAWWAGPETEPLRYVTERAPWADPNIPTLMPRLAGRAILAAVRSATPGMPGGVAAVAPFSRGRLAVAHNGAIEQFDGAVGRDLLARLPEGYESLLAARTDSLALFAHLVAAFEAAEPGGAPGARLARAAAATCRRVAEIARRHDAAAGVNLLACDGEALVGVRAAVRVRPNPLYVLEDGARWPGALLAASEPLDDDRRWRAVEPGHLVTLGPGGIHVSPLDGAAGG
jgi:glutamine amidotransferase